jgi:hypothetical protein
VHFSFTPKQKTDYSDALLEHFLPFNPNWVKSVDFGALCLANEIQKTVDFLKANYPKNILCRKAEFHKTEYALEYKAI